MDSPHKGQWRGVLMFSLMCAWTNGWENNRDASDLGRHDSHCDVTLMYILNESWCLVGYLPTWNKVFLLLFVDSIYGCPISKWATVTPDMACLSIHQIVEFQHPGPGCGLLFGRYHRQLDVNAAASMSRPVEVTRVAQHADLGGRRVEGGAQREDRTWGPLQYDGVDTGVVRGVPVGVEITARN